MNFAKWKLYDSEAKLPFPGIPQVISVPRTCRDDVNSLGIFVSLSLFQKRGGGLLMLQEVSSA